MFTFSSLVVLVDYFPQCAHMSVLRVVLFIYLVNLLESYLNQCRGTRVMSSQNSARSRARDARWILSAGCFTLRHYCLSACRRPSRLPDARAISIGLMNLFSETTWVRSSALLCSPPRPSLHRPSLLRPGRPRRGLAFTGGGEPGSRSCDVISSR